MANQLPEALHSENIDQEKQRNRNTCIGSLMSPFAHCLEFYEKEKPFTVKQCEGNQSSDS